MNDEIGTPTFNTHGTCVFTSFPAYPDENEKNRFMQIVVVAGLESVLRVRTRREVERAYIIETH